MKRRGFVPSFATYLTMLGRYAEIEDLSQRTKQLVQIQSLYEAFEALVEHAQSSDPDALKDMHNGPFNAYLRCLANAYLYDKMFEVFHSSPSNGPLAANAHTYTTLFQALGERPPREGTSFKESRKQNAADARFLWQNMIRASNDDQVAVDEYLIRTIIRVLSLGSSPDHKLAFSIIHEYLGLAEPTDDLPPKEDAPSPRQQVQISPQILQSILELCNRTNHFDLCVRYLESVLRRRVDVRQRPDRSHIMQVLLAHAALAAESRIRRQPDIAQSKAALKLLEWLIQEHILRPNQRSLMTPTLSLYEIVMATCMLVGDWPTAVRVFFLMTGYELESAKDTTSDSEPRMRSKKLEPNFVVMGYLARIASQLDDREVKKQCVLALVECGGRQFLLEDQPLRGEIKAYTPYYQLKLAEAVMQLHAQLAREAVSSEAMKVLWKEMVAEAKVVKERLVKQAERRDLPVPILEREFEEGRAQRRKRLEERKMQTKEEEESQSTTSITRPKSRHRSTRTVDTTIGV